MKSPLKYFVFALILIAIDQAIKLWMHFYVRPTYFGEIDIIPEFFKLHYVTNKGMAFGMELGGEYGKLILTTFRLFAMAGIGWYLAHLANRGAANGLLWSIAAVLGGAIGNVIDSTFYGVYLDNAPIEAPTKWFHGQVIDMFYFNYFDRYYPEWVPLIGGQYNTTPIFNFADACIFCGVLTILLFQKRFFAPLNEAQHKNEEETESELDAENDNENPIEETTSEVTDSLEEEQPLDEVIETKEIISTEKEEIEDK
jgi:signal peptidase II